jgi:hypothetical protein
MKRPSKFKNIYAYFLMFVMSLTLTLTIAVIISAMTVFSPSSFSTSLFEIRYDERAAELAKQEAIEIGLLYGVESSVLERLDFLSYAQPVVFSEFPKNINENLDRVSVLFGEDVKKALIEYAQSLGLSMTQEVAFGINEMTQQVVEAFQQAVAIPLHQSYFNLMSTFKRIVLPIILISLIVLLVQQQILYRLNRRDHMLHLAYMFASSGWMLIIIPAGLLFSGFYRRIMITPDYFLDLISHMFETSLWSLVIAGGLLLSLSVASFVFGLRKSQPRL